MKPNNTAAYLQVLTDVMQHTEKVGGDMNADFEQLKQALADGDVKTLGAGKLAAIATNFQSGTDVYLADLHRLETAKAPVRLLGKHKQLVVAYRDYTEACQAMVDAIDAENETVDAAVFSDAEHEQEAMMTKISTTMQRIIGAAM